MVKQNKSKNKAKDFNSKERCTCSSPNDNKRKQGNNADVTERGRMCKACPACSSENIDKDIKQVTSNLDGETAENITNSAGTSRHFSTMASRVDNNNCLTQDFMRIVVTIVTKYRLGIFKLSSIVLFTVILLTAASKRGFTYTPCVDVFVYCCVYSTWVVTCLPWLLAELNTKTFGLIAGVFARLFAADVAILGWASFRGDTHILHRGLRLKPLMEPSLSWLANAGYSLRFGVVVAVVSAAVIKVILESQHFKTLSGSKLFHSSRNKPTTFSPPSYTRHQMNRKATSLSRCGSSPKPKAAMETGGIGEDVCRQDDDDVHKSSATLLHHLEESIRHAASSIPKADMTYSSRHSPDTLHTDRSKKEKRHRKRHRPHGSPPNICGGLKTDMSDNNSKLKHHQGQFDPVSYVKLTSSGDSELEDHRMIGDSDKDSNKSLALTDMCRNLLNKETINLPNGSCEDKKVNDIKIKGCAKSKFTFKRKNSIENTENKRQLKMPISSKVQIRAKNKALNASCLTKYVMQGRIKNDVNKTSSGQHSKQNKTLLVTKPTKVSNVEERAKKMALFSEKIRHLNLAKREGSQKRRSQSEQPSMSRARDIPSKLHVGNTTEQNCTKGSLNRKQKLLEGNYSKTLSRRKLVSRSMPTDEKKEI